MAHHLILGQLTDFLTGHPIDDTHDERYRQKIARLLVEDKGYAKSDILAGRSVSVSGGRKNASVPITYIIELQGRESMLIHYGPGSLVTRHRPALALARLAAPHQIPVVVVTNGETADILNTLRGRMTATGLAQIPSKAQLTCTLQDYVWEGISEHRAVMERRIVMAYEVDDRCPCDDTVCTWEES